MTEENFYEIINGLSKREQTIAKNLPFYSMIVNAYNNNKYRDLHISSVALSILEYLLIEGSLKNKGISYSEIKRFIEKTLKDGFDINIDDEELSEFTKYLFNKLSNNGSAFKYQYFNPTTQTDEVINVRYITSIVDRESRDLIVYITSEGMEFLLNTKEVDDEYKISVHVLLLQKMISTNNLEDVLRGVKALNAEILKQIRKKQDIVEVLQYSDENKFEEYFNYIKSSIRILTDDGSQLTQTKESMKKYEDDLLDNIKKDDLTPEKEEYIKSQIKRINDELERCLNSHQTLITEAVDLIKRKPELQKNRLKRKFSSSFNIEDKLNSIVKNDRLDYLRYLVEPLFKPNISKIFNILKLDTMFLYKEKIVEEDTYEAQTEENLGISITFDSEMDETKHDNYTFYMRNLINFAIEEGEFDFKSFIEYINELHGTKPLENSDIRPFILSLSSKEFNELSYKTILEKQHNRDIDKVFIEVISENKDIKIKDFVLKQISFSNEVIYLPNLITFKNFTLRCDFK